MLLKLRRHSVQVLLVTLIVCFSFAALYPATRGPELFDATANLRPLEPLQTLGLAEQVNALVSIEFLKSTRPLAILSFVIHNESDGMDIQAAKIGNLLIHLVNGLLVLALGLRIRKATGNNFPSLIPYFIAALFLLHPINLSVVYLAIQRMTSLSTTFMLVGTFFYVEALGRRLNDLRLLRDALLSLLIFPTLAFLSKENGILVYSYYALLSIFIIPKSELHVPRSAIYLLLFFPGIALAYQFLSTSGFAGGYEGRPFTLTERTLTQARVLLDYAIKIIYPFSSDFSAYHDDFEVSRSIINPPTTLFSIILILFGCVGSLIFRKRRPLIAFAVFTFLFGHLIESTVVPLEMYFEHRNYSALAFICVGIIGAPIRCNLRTKATYFLGTLASLGILLSALVNAHNNAEKWRSNKSIVNSIIETHPQSPRGLSRVALSSWTQGRHEEGLRHLEQAAALSPQKMGPHLQYFHYKWASGDVDSRDVIQILTGDWRCFDPLAIAEIEAMATETEGVFTRVLPLIFAAIDARLDRLNCHQRALRLQFRRATIHGRGGDIEKYLQQMEQVIDRAPTESERIYFCGQLHVVGLPLLPRACQPHLEKIIKWFDPRNFSTPNSQK